MHGELMHTLHVDSGREMRGGQWQALRLVERLPAEGVSATLLCREAGPLYRRAAEAGVDVRPLSLWRLAMLARGAALVHAHDARSHTLAALAAPGRPLVVARRVAFPVRASWKYRRADKYIAVSEYVRQVMAEGGVPAERVAVVHDGVPLLAAARGGARVIAPELADPLKGADVVKKAAALAGVEVQFSGNLETDLDGAGVFVYVTRSEGLGSAVLLAMSEGVPVIASRVGGIVEIVEDGVNGLLIENSAECAAEAIARVRADPAWARAMGERGRRIVEEKFSVDRMVRGTIEVYRKVLA